MIQVHPSEPILGQFKMNGTTGNSKGVYEPGISINIVKSVNLF